MRNMEENQNIEWKETWRVETYPFPKDAVREALYNALVHCRWSAGIPVQIRIEDETMYVSNECAFPTDWTAETLLQRHQSRPYNPRIAQAFFRAGYIESWGRGIQKIFEVCRESGAPDPEYVVHAEDITIKLAAVSEVSVMEQAPITEADGAENEPGWSEIRHEIVNYLEKKPTATQNELSAHLHVSRGKVQRAMKELAQEGTILREGGRRYGLWKVQR